jgi:protease-4
MSDNPTPPPPRRFSFWRWLGWAMLVLVLVGSLTLNVVVIWALSTTLNFWSSENAVVERHLAGQANSPNKIAVIHINGVLMEGLTGFARREIDRAAKDNGVKAVILRINSPGGTITSSDDLHRRILELRDGSPLKKTSPKPVIASMGSIAASGAYYLAMPAHPLIAERTTATGSIGVFAAFPNVTELSKKVGFSMTLFRAGDVKDSGSPFRNMSEKEAAIWQDLVNHSYLQFLQVVEEGRPQLKGKLQEDISIDETVPIRDEKARVQHRHYTRYRADGGVFTADLAKKYGLIDNIGYLDDAIVAARQAAGLGENEYNVVSYERPLSLVEEMLGIKARPPASALDPARLAEGAVPRLWYLAPQSEFAGILAAMARQEMP